MTRVPMPLLAGLVASASVLTGAWTRRPISARRAEDRRRGDRRHHPLDSLTIKLCQAARCPVPDPARRRRLRRLTALTTAALWLAPPLGLIVPCCAWLVSRYDVARSRRRLDRAVVDALPDAVDLLLLATSAGRSLPIAHPLVASRLPAPLGPALQLAAAEAAGGRPRADALVDALAPYGARAAALGHALGDHLRYGVPLLPTLERMGMEVRLDRRRLAEERARRVPVRLLGPLVICVLPALGLLTVVPLLVTSLRTLPT